jgi:hypothetical protein
MLREESMLTRLARVPSAAVPRGWVPSCWKRAAMTCVVALMLGACVQPWQQFEAGQDQSTIIARMGPPRETYDLPNGGRRLMWPTQPMGTTTVAADIDASGKIVNVRQVLQISEFNRAQIGTWTRNDVLINFGRPVDTAFFRLSQREVWSYRYVENNITPLLFSFSFDTSGVLRETQRTPDPLRDPTLRRF